MICCAASRAARRWARSCGATGCRPACRRRSPSPTARRCPLGCWARTWWCSATPTGGSACSTSIARTAVLRSPLARNEECGLRCLYHGWKFDVDGNVVEMASEPAQSRLHGQGEAQGLSHARRAAASSGPIWARRRRCPNSSHRRGRRRPTPSVSVVKMHVAATGRRSLEGRSIRRIRRACIRPTCRRRSVDGAKATGTDWLRPSTDKAPRFQIQRTGYGFRYAAIRRPIMNEATHDYIRITVYIAPFTALIPPNNVHNVATL